MAGLHFFTMSSTQSQTDICNLALMRLGQNKIQSITNLGDPNAIACNVAWQQALSEVSREGPWNCLKTRAFLAQLPPAPGSQASNTNNDLAGATVWAPGTNYAVNQFVTYASYLYQCLIANTSGPSFTVDLTKGYWFQTNYFDPNYLGPQPGNAGPLYEWNFAYQLPRDFILLTELNGNSCWGWNGQGAGNTTGSLYEVYQEQLVTNAQSANIKYNRYETDTTKFDSLFTGALVLNLAATIATQLRKDDAELSVKMLQLYKQYVGRAMTKNAGESNPRRYNIVSQSRFVASRRWSTNG